MDSLLNALYELKELLIICIAGGVVFFAFFSVIAGNITWKSRSLRLLGLFMGLSIKDMLWMSAGAVRILYIITVCVFTQRITTMHTVLYIALVLISVVTFLGFPRVLIDLVNAAAVYAALIALGILIGYFRDVNNEPMIIVVYVLLSIFIVLYSVYFYMKGVSEMIKGKLEYNSREVSLNER